LPVFFFFACNGEKKSDFENDKYVDIMGAPRDTLIGKSGLRMQVPALYQVTVTEPAGGPLVYAVVPADTTNNHSAIRIILGVPDTSPPAGNF
jgi:hypothetical protein